MACESLVLVLLAVALLQPVSAYYPLPYTQGESPGNGESRSCGCRTIKLVGFIRTYNEDKLLDKFPPCRRRCGVRLSAVNYSLLHFYVL